MAEERSTFVSRFVSTMMAVPMVVCSVGLASAQTGSAPPSRIGVGVSMTTLGVAIQAATPLGQRANIRAGFDVFSLNHSFDDDGITLASQLKLRSFSAYLDWFPTGGGFHVSPGLMIYNGNEVDAGATVPNGNKFTLGNEDLFSNPANPVTGSAKISFEKVAPVLLLGWGNMIPRGARHWSIPVEFGIVYSRAPMATLNLTGSACSTSSGGNCRNIATDPGLQSDLKTQQDKMNSDLSPLKVLPVFSMGFAYRF